MTEGIMFLIFLSKNSSKLGPYNVRDEFSAGLARYAKLVMAGHLEARSFLQY